MVTLSNQRDDFWWLTDVADALVLLMRWCSDAVSYSLPANYIVHLIITFYILHLTFNILHFTFYILHFTFYISHFTFYILNFTFYILPILPIFPFFNSIEQFRTVYTYIHTSIPVNGANTTFFSSRNTANTSFFQHKYYIFSTRNTVRCKIKQWLAAMMFTHGIL